jgi:hypothetical protein
MRAKPAWIAGLVVWLMASTLGQAQQADADGDGIPDNFEQTLLVKFVPTFHVSRSDCDVAPAEFKAFSRDPVVAAKNGTIYGQVLPVRKVSRPGMFLEIHYYHLWAEDCGKPAHALDAESVSVLVQAEKADWRVEAWRASYWYAGAHEDTLCDMSNIARAELLDAVVRGAQVWISRDKHASFLSPRLCKQGCGKDDCSETTPLTIKKLVNLGEPGFAMNGTEWAASPSWRLASKMTPDFSDELVARIADRDEASVVTARDVARGLRTTIRVAGNTYWSLAAANANTGSSVVSGVEGGSTGIAVGVKSAGIAVKHTDKAVRKSLSATGGSLKRSFRWMKPSSGAGD